MKPPEMDPTTKLIDNLVKTAVAEAIEEHRRMGRSIVVWRDGKVVIVPPEEIPPLKPDQAMPFRD